MEPTVYRYLVVDAGNDDFNEGGLGGIFPFATREQAEWFAEQKYESNLGYVMSAGGYPGETVVIDLANPDPAILDDPEIWVEDFAQAEAREVYEDPHTPEEEILQISPAAKDLIRRWLEEDEDAEERTWVHSLKIEETQ